MTKAEIDANFTDGTGPPNFGTDYTGVWSGDSKTLTITINAAGGTLAIGDTITGAGTTNIADANGGNEDLISGSTAIPLTGDFGDTTAPVVTAPADIPGVEAASPTGAFVAHGGATALDNIDGVIAATCDFVSGSEFPLGATLVTCSATDNAGLTGENTFTITVVDTTPPSIDTGSVPDNIRLPFNDGVEFDIPTATDVDGVDPSPTVTCTIPGDPDPVEVSGDGSDDFPLDKTTVTCVATDAADNDSAEETFTVNLAQVFLDDFPTKANQKWGTDVTLEGDVIGCLEADQLRVEWDDTGDVFDLFDFSCPSGGLVSWTTPAHQYGAKTSGDLQAINVTLVGSDIAFNITSTTPQPHDATITVVIPDVDETDPAVTDPSVPWGYALNVQVTITDDDDGGSAVSAQSVTLGGSALDAGVTGATDSTGLASLNPNVLGSGGNAGTEQVTFTITNASYNFGAVPDEDVVITKHHTQLNTDLEDVDETDAIDASVFWDYKFEINSRLIDLNASSTVITGTIGDDMDEKITYTSDALDTTPDATITADPTLVSAFADYNDDLLATGSSSVSTTDHTFLAEFAESTDYLESSNSSSTMRVTPHHTQLFTDLEDVDETDAIDASVFWDYKFKIDSTLFDLNETGTEANTGELDTETITYTSDALASAGPTATIDTTGAASMTFDDDLLATGSSSVSTTDHTWLATFAQTDTDDYVGSTNDSSTMRVTPHHTQLFTDLEDVDETDAIDASVFWDFKFKIDSTLFDLNETGTEANTGELDTETITYTSDALDTDGPTATIDTTGAASMTFEDDLLARGTGTFTDVDDPFTATFAQTDTDDYVSSDNSSSTMKVTKHHTSLTLNSFSTISTTSAITAAGILIDLNDTATCLGCVAPAVRTGNVEGKTITFSGSGAGGLLAAITAGINITGPTAETVVCTDCSPEDALIVHLNKTAIIDFHPGARTVLLQVQNTSSNHYFKFNVTLDTDPLSFATLSSTGLDNQTRLVTISSAVGIKSMKLFNITDGFAGAEIDSSVGIGFIKLSNDTSKPGEIMTLNFTDDQDDVRDQVVAGAELDTPLTFKEGSYHSTGPAVGTIDNSFVVKANFTGDGDYVNSTNENPPPVTYDTVQPTISSTQLGTGGNQPFSPAGFEGATFSAEKCSKKNPDADGDGICESWEIAEAVVYKIDRKLKEIDLPTDITPLTDPGFGSMSDGKKDIFVEIDYMTGHRPDTTAMNNVIDAFFNSPVDSGAGVNLYLFIDENVTHHTEFDVWRDVDNIDTDDSKAVKDRHFGPRALRSNVTDLDATPTHSISGSVIQILSPTIMFTTNKEHSTVLNPGVGDDRPSEGVIVTKIKATFNSNPGGIDLERKQPKASVNLGEVGFDSVEITVESPGIGSDLLTTERVFTLTLPYEVDSNLDGADATITNFGVKFKRDTGATITSVEVIESHPVIHPIEIENYAQVVRYALFVHNVGTLCGPSGLSEGPGNDMIISLGCNWTSAETGTHDFDDGDPDTDETVGSVNEQAGTFMHELGHLLGLLHGGPNNPTLKADTSNSENCKPNYPSVMSYARQVDTYLGTGFLLDYSSGDNDDLDEDSLVESDGISSSGAAVNYITIWGTPDQTIKLKSANTTVGGGVIAPIDWDGDTVTDVGSIVADINAMNFTGCIPDPADLDTTDILVDFDDWGDLVYDFRAASGGSFDGIVPDTPFTQQILREITGLVGQYSGVLEPLFRNADLNIFKSGASVNISFHLNDTDTDGDGISPPITDATESITFEVKKLVVGGLVDVKAPKGKPTPTDFVYNAIDNTWKIRWKTPNEEGTYELKFRLSDGSILVDSEPSNAEISGVTFAKGGEVFGLPISSRVLLVGKSVGAGPTEPSPSGELDLSLTDPPETGSPFASNDRIRFVAQVNDTSIIPVPIEGATVRVIISDSVGNVVFDKTDNTNKRGESVIQLQAKKLGPGDFTYVVKAAKGEQEGEDIVGSFIVEP